tara:strand:+ start:11874 stop:13415 length:1542 start_codon:yes stop_codon:yes gene_type:complete
MSKKQVLKNLISAWLSKGIKLITGLFIIPVFISELGVEGYGLIIVLTSILSFTVLADFGIRASLVRYLISSKVNKNFFECNQFLNTAFAIYLLIFFCLASIIYLLAPQLADIMKVNKDLYSSFINLLRTFGIISIFISFMIPIFSAINASNNRYDIVNYRQGIIGTFSSLVMLIGVKFFSIGINGWAVISISSSLIIAISIAYEGFKQAPYLKIHPKFFDKKKISKILKFGGIVSIGGWSRMMKIEADPLIISSLTGMSDASLYRSGVTLPSHTRPLISAFCGQLHPLTTESHEKNDDKKTHLLFEKGSSITLLMGSIMLFFFIFFSNDLINIWLGNVLPKKDIIQVVYCLKAMALVDFCFYIEGSSYSILYAKNHLKFMTLTDLCLGITNILSSFLLYKFSDFGVVSVIIPTIIIEGLARPYYLFYTAKVIKYKTSLVWSKILKPSFKVILIVILTSLLISQLFNFFNFDFLLELIIKFFFFIFVSIFSIFFIGLDSLDRKTISNLITNFIK